MILYRVLYSVFIIFYLALIRLASLWNPKARQWINGRKNILSTVRRDFQKQRFPIIWMHCSSLGEFEQGRPLIEKIRMIYPGYKFVLTFFSPSGYTVVKGKAVADHIYYLPFGNRLVASRFIDIIDPVLVLWIKYDYWYYYLHELKKRNTPLLLISGNFHKDHAFFKWYGTMHRRMLECFTHLFVQTKYSKTLLDGIGFSNNVTISGDTRFDRVIEISEQFERIEAIEKFCGTNSVIVAGSTWPEDEEELDHFANTHPEIKFIIAPHEIHDDHLKEIEKLFQRTIRYSVFAAALADDRSAMIDDRSPMAGHLNNIREHTFKTISEKTQDVHPRQSSAIGHHDEGPNVLIIDNIGMLSRLYKYASITYVGGGFGQSGVHNVLEAAVYGKPVIFGPVFNKFIEAIELLEESGAVTIETALELEKIFTDLFSDHQLYMEVSEAAKKYVYSKRGATARIIEYIQENRLLTN